MTDVSLFSQAPQKYADRAFKIGHDHVTQISLIPLFLIIMQPTQIKSVIKY